MQLILLRLIRLSALFFLMFAGTGLAAVTINDDRGGHTFETIPQRVVVLDWDLLEQTLSLGITPAGATETSGYRQWVGLPVLTENVADTGTRAEPNLEKIAGLKPDVILAGASQADLIPLLEQIAPVVYLTNFSSADDAAPVAIRHLKTLGILFGREQQADAQLAALTQRFTALSHKLAAVYPPGTRVTVIRFSTLITVFLPADNSAVNYVLRNLGLTPAIPLDAQPWGIAQRRINVLQDAGDGYVLWFRPFPEEKKLADTRLWQAMPFVKQGKINGVAPVWNYGGVRSLQRMADAITDSLLEIAPAS